MFNQMPADGADSRYAAYRLFIIMLIMTVGGCGQYIVSVVLPTVQAEFGASRSDTSLAYTAMMIGFGVGGILMGKLADRYGIRVPLLVGATSLCIGFVSAALVSNIWLYIIIHGFFVGMFGSSCTFGPLMADTTLWWNKRRGIAVAICASGNYLAGTVWPPIIQHFVETSGWRATYIGLGIFCLLAMGGMALLLNRRPPIEQPASGSAMQRRASLISDKPFGLSPGKAQALLCVAGLACCVAMAMPQVHIVAYCSDLGFGPARGAEMLSLMLACGIVSRIISGLICDRIGGLRTLLLGSVLQCVALILFLPFDGMVSLYVISGLFGLFQGGLVPAYAIIVREYFSPKEAGARVGTVIMFTMLGMALGGWMSGKVFDLTGSYAYAFINGILWNLLNMSIAVFLLRRSLLKPPETPAVTSAVTA